MSLRKPQKTFASFIQKLLPPICVAYHFYVLCCTLLSKLKPDLKEIGGPILYVPCTAHSCFSSLLLLYEMNPVVTCTVNPKSAEREREDGEDTKTRFQQHPSRGEGRPRGRRPIENNASPKWRICTFAAHIGKEPFPLYYCYDSM